MSKRDAKCADDSCANAANWGDYCVQHVCMHGACRLRRVDGSEWCPSHKPDEPAPTPEPDDTLAEWRAAQYTREQWLNQHAGLILDLYRKKIPDFTPPAIRVSCGWPGIAPGGRVDCVRGVCYDAAGSADAHHEIFVSPMMADGYEVLATIAHEVTHAIVGVSHNHDDVFVAMGERIGMTGAEQMEPSVELEVKLRAMLVDAPAYPHAALNPPPPDPQPAPPVQTGRLLKATCPTCGYVIRLTMKWASRGLPVCPFDSVPFALCAKPAERES